jgi:uncharacterized membrane protein YsdA (DUF1294 family)
LAKKRRSLKQRYTVIVFIFAVILTLASILITQHYGLIQFNPVTVAILYLISINSVAFLTYGFDKNRAKTGRQRIPEFTLVSTVFMGGTIGAYLGRIVFRHKTSKKSFRVKFWIAVVIQIILIAGLVWLQYRNI